MKNKSLKAGLVAIAILNTFTPTPVNAGAKANALGLAGVVVSVGTGIAAGVVKGKTSKKFKTYQETQSAADQKAYEASLNAYRWLTGVAVGTGVSTATGYGLFRYLVRCRINELLQAAQTKKVAEVDRLASRVTGELSLSDRKTFFTKLTANSDARKAKKIRDAAQLIKMECFDQATATEKNRTVLDRAVLAKDAPLTLMLLECGLMTKAAWRQALQDNLQTTDKALLLYALQDITKAEEELNEAALLEKYATISEELSPEAIDFLIAEARKTSSQQAYARLAYVLAHAPARKQTKALEGPAGRETKHGAAAIFVTAAQKGEVDFVSLLLDLGYETNDTSAPLSIHSAMTCYKMAQPDKKVAAKNIVKRLISGVVSKSRERKPVIGDESVYIDNDSMDRETLETQAQSANDADILGWIKAPASVLAI